MAKRIVREEIDRLFDYGLYVPTRTLYIGSASSDENGESGVDSIMAERAIKGITLLDQTDGEITIITNNVGGDYYHGMAIYDAIKACKNTVTMKVYGHAMSMGALILQAADERVLAPNAKVMIHYGYMGMDSNHTKIFQKWSEECKKMDEAMEDLLLEKIKEKHPTFKKEQLEKMLDYDTILNATEAVALGLADKVE